jgi:hypothetical protein
VIPNPFYDAFENAVKSLVNSGEDLDEVTQNYLNLHIHELSKIMENIIL